MNQSHFTWDQVDGCIKFTLIYMHRNSVFSLRTTNSGAIPPFTNPGAQKKSEKNFVWTDPTHKLLAYWKFERSTLLHPKSSPLSQPRGLSC